MSNESTHNAAAAAADADAATGPGRTASENSRTDDADLPMPAELTPQLLDELKSKAEKADEYWERLIRTTADFDNFKKRAARERQDAVKYANEELLEKLIPVLDNFDMAVAAASGAQGGSSDALRTGVNMILSQLKSVMVQAGLEEIDATGQPFDPNFHEAVSHQASSEVPEGSVLQQLRRGYKLRDRLIRPATVIVAKGGQTSAAA